MKYVARPRARSRCGRGVSRCIATGVVEKGRRKAESEGKRTRTRVEVNGGGE
jgi:hypothetical protein